MELRQRRVGDKAEPESTPDSLHDGKFKYEDKQYARTPRAWPMLLGFCLFYAVSLGYVYHRYVWLPPAKSMDAPSTEFSEDRARKVLDDIMGFGYRPVGSVANEELTPNYLLQEIEAIQKNAAPNVLVEVDVQRPSGAFGLDFLSRFQNIYANITNILVRVTPSAPNSANSSLLLSSHYDAAIGGAAASDDGVNIAIMMELLSIYTKHPPTHNSLIFNFNGGEETLCQASHGFITQHPWTQTIKAFINLEAIGAGGRELLFQTSSDELALAYAQGAPYPHASIIAQEVFQLGIINGETDFRIYRDFGGVAGMDFAYISNGYVYHTHLDVAEAIQPGSIQRLGENVQGVVDQLMGEDGRLERVAQTYDTSNTLFFDIGGHFMITTSKTVTFGLCIGVVILAAAFIASSPIPFSRRFEALRFFGKCTGASFVTIMLVGVLLSVFAPLSWYARPLLAGPLFLASGMAAMVQCLMSFLQSSNKSKRDLWQMEEALFEVTMWCWLGGLLLLLSMGAISAYLTAIWVFFPLVGQVTCYGLRRLGNLSMTSYIGISLASVTLPVLLAGLSISIAYTFFIPLMGRSGPLVPPDLLIAVVFWVSLIEFLSYTCRFFCFVPVQHLRVLRNVLVGISMTGIVFASLWNPYTELCPKHLIVQHVGREVTHSNGSTTSDAGMWISSMDFRGVDTIHEYLKDTQWANLPLLAAPQALHESAEIYGHMPYALPVRHFVPERYSWYLPTNYPVLPEDIGKPQLSVLSSVYNAETDRRRIHLKFTGPSHLNLYIDAQKTKLTSWSMGEGDHGPVPESDDSYILQFASGNPPSEFDFWIEAESDYPIELAFVGHYLTTTTPEMKELFDALPTWTTSISGISTWNSVQI